MKSTGSTCKLDHVGRMVLPHPLREKYGLLVPKGETVKVELLEEGGYIILRKYEPGCIFCHEIRDILPFKERYICRACLAQLNKTAQSTQE